MKSCSYPFAIVAILFLLTFSCAKKKDAAITLPNAEPYDGHYLVNSSGDTIPTGVPIPAKPLKIPVDSLAQPRTVSLGPPSAGVPAYSNVQPAKAPKVIALSGAPKTVQYTIDTLRVRGRRTATFQPKPVPALPFGMKRSATYDIQSLSEDQGLLSGQIAQILEDKRGHLWLGDRVGGLVRYDGKQFSYFTQNNGLYQNGVWCMTEDRQGNIWLGTWDQVVTRFDGHFFTHFLPEKDDFFGIGAVEDIMEDTQGSIWMVTPYGLGRLDLDETGTAGAISIFRFEPEAFKRGITSLLEDRQGNIWIGGYDAVAKFDGAQFHVYTPEMGLGVKQVHDITEDRNGHLWFAGFPGVSRFNGSTFYHYTTDHGLAGNYLTKITEDRQRNLWFSISTQGVNRFDPTSGESGTFHYFSEREGLSSNEVTSIHEDRFGNLWLATPPNGISRLNPNGFRHFSQAEGLLEDPVWALVQDEWDQIWMTNGSWGLRERGINRFDGAGFAHYDWESDFFFNQIRCILEDSRGDLWFGSAGQGIDRLQLDANGEGGTLTHYGREEGLSNGFIWSLLEDRNGHIWVGTGGMGITRFTPDQQGDTSFTYFTEEEGLASNLILSLFEDKNGYIWMGTGRGGITRFDGETFIHYTEKEGLANNSVQVIYEDSAGKLWFGTHGGLSIFDGRNFRNYRWTDGLSASNVVSSIKEDSEQNIWISTAGGIYRFSPDSTVGENPAPTHFAGYRIFSYGKGDGIKSAKYDNQGSVLLDNQNQMWWGGSQGLSRLDLNSFELPTDPPEKLGLSFLEVVEQFVDYRRLADTAYRSTFAFGEVLSRSFDSVAAFSNYPLNLRLPHYLNHLTFHFTGTDWQAPHKLWYSYMIDGVDPEWSMPGPGLSADYRNLPYGTHTLQVRAIGAAQGWSDIFTYTFTIRPPFWLTMWAFLFYGLVALGVFYVIYRWRTRQLRAKVEEQERQIEKEQAFNLELQELNEANSRFVPVNFLEILGKKSIKELRLGDQTGAKMTILFSDIRAYTQLSETMSPDDNFKFINGYLGRVGPVIKKHGGFIDKYLGDGLMALFLNNHTAALRAAIEMQGVLHGYNRERKAKGRALVRTGMGLNTGDLMLGIIGDEHRYDSTVISDAVNTASRMEGLTKMFGGSVILSEKTQSEIDNPQAFQYRFLGRIKVKGKDKALKIYDFFDGDPEPVRRLKAQTKAGFEKAIAHYFNREFGMAADIFKVLVEKFPDDLAAQFYFEKALKFVIDGVDEEWSGVERLEIK